MGFSDQFFMAINIDKQDKPSLSKFANKSGVPVSRLKYYNDNNICPTGNDLDGIVSAAGITLLQLQVSMGIFSRKTIAKVQCLLSDKRVAPPVLASTSLASKVLPEPRFSTTLGKLYQSDCMDFLSSVDNDSIDMVFADPPFNLAKLYPSNIDDNIKTESYLDWCEEWIAECARVLKPGGSLFLWNLPKWNSQLSGFLNGILTFRHWITVDIKYSLPIQGKLYPSHYSLLYFTKGPKPSTFHPDRLPMSVCPKCFHELKDYGGYKDKMNPNGINMSDVWSDIPPVRHSKYKRRQGANELSLKLLDRVIEMSTNEGDIILDPFGGSGTTYMAAELKGRKWIGSEIGPVDDIVQRFEVIEDEALILESYRKEINHLFTPKSKRERIKRGIWTDESFERT